MAYQPFFDALPEPWNGLGVQANYTYVDNQGITNSGLSTVSGNGGTCSRTADHVHGPAAGRVSRTTPTTWCSCSSSRSLGARLAWNWRDDYLISQSDCCIKLPIWQDAYGQLDGSVHYKPS